MDGDEVPGSNPTAEIAAEMAAAAKPAAVTEVKPEPVVEATPEPEIESTASAEEPAQELPKPEDQAKPKGKNTPWYQKRINELAEEKNTARKEADTIKQQNAALVEALAKARSGESVDEQPTRQELPQQNLTRQEIQTEAQKIVAQQNFDNACNATAEKGEKDFPDFKEALSTFGLLGGLPIELAQIANRMADGHKVLHYLGKNPDEAARVLRLAPVEMALEVAEMRGKLTKSAPLSKAPAPIKTIEGTAKPAFDMLDPQADMDQFAEVYLKQRGKRS